MCFFFLQSYISFSKWGEKATFFYVTPLVSKFFAPFSSISPCFLSIYQSKVWVQRANKFCKKPICLKKKCYICGSKKLN